MKTKICAMLLTFCLLISFAACGVSSSVKEDSSANRTSKTENNVVLEVKDEVTTQEQTTVMVQETTTFNAIDAMETIVDLPYIDVENIPADFIMNTFSDPKEPEKGIGNITYNGGDIVLYFETSVSEEYRQFGLFYIINGIRQPLRVEENGVVSDVTQMYVCDIEKGEAADLKIYITPNTGLIGETVYLTENIYTFPTCVAAEEMYTAFADGYDSDSVTTSYPVTVYMNADGTNGENVNKNSSNVRTEDYAPVISKKIARQKAAEKLGLSSSSVGTTVFPEGVFYKNIDENIYMDQGSLVYDRTVKIDGSETEKISLALFEQLSDHTGEFSGEYRVSLYIDHEIVSAFDGCNYANIKIEKGKQTVIDFEIDTTELSDYGRCYLILVKLDGNSHEVHKVDCLLEKN